MLPRWEPEELLFDALRGNSVRFARQDYVEQAWRIVDPVLDNVVPIYEYKPGTWGSPKRSSSPQPTAVGSIRRRRDKVL
jgi:glucose-6-phosphate 1-dehydrogenase